MIDYLLLGSLVHQLLLTTRQHLFVLCNLPDEGGSKQGNMIAIAPQAGQHCSIDITSHKFFSPRFGT